MEFVEASTPQEYLSARAAVDYELAGRLPSQPYQDLRSASKARRRNKAKSQKYYSHRHVNAGQVGREHHCLPDWRIWETILPADAPISALTKQEVYREAQRYPRPWTYHRRPRFFDHWPYHFRKERQRYEKKHAEHHIRESIEEAEDSMFMALVVGHGDERDLDDHIFRRCDVCWPELESWYTDNEMFDGDGNRIGQWSDAWEVGFEGVDAGYTYGLAGRCKIGATFLMTDEDLRNWPAHTDTDCSEDDEYEEDNVLDGEKAGAEYRATEDRGPMSQSVDDSASDSWSWDDVLQADCRDSTPEDDWELLSDSCTWSMVSR